MKLIELFIIYKCKKCKSKFSFNNKLHQHVRNQCSDKFHKISFYSVEQNENEFNNSNFFKKNFNSTKFLSIIISAVNSNQKLKSDFEFQKYQYVIVYLNFTEKTSQQTNCFDTNVDFIIANKFFFLNQSKASIRTMTIEITIRSIDVNKHKTKKYVISLIYFQKKNSFEKKIRACLIREIHLIENFKINILINTDIFTSENFVLDFKQNQTLINSCDVIIFITSRRHFKSMIHHMISFKKIIIIFSRFQLRVRIHHLIFFQKRDFLFESENINFSMYVHVIEFDIKSILLQNEKNKSIKVFRNFRFDRVVKLNYFNVY